MDKFFEKLKKGMGVDLPDIKALDNDEPEPSREKTKTDSFPAPSAGGAAENREDEATDEPIEEIEEETAEAAPVAQFVGAKIPALPAGRKSPAKKIRKIKNVLKAEAENGKEERKIENKKRWFEPEGELAIDAFTTDKEFIARCPIAGLEPENLDISVENDMLIIRGRRTTEEFGKVDNYIFRECFWGAFSKKIMLPEDVDAENIKASMKEGVLTVRIPKISKGEKKKIVVR